MIESPAFITFADGRYAWRATGRRILRQASGSGYFSSSTLKNSQDPTRTREFGEMDSAARGFGYWRWKPQIVYQQLQSLPSSVPGLWYVDAGCTIFNSSEAKSRMEEYLEFGLANQVGTFFQLSKSFSDLSYTKRLTHATIPISLERQKEGQVQATAFFIANSSGGKELVSQWASLSRHAELFDDSSNIASEYCPAGQYVDHRHDQSVLSLLVKSRDIALLPDELNQDRKTTVLEQTENRVSVPIVATRHKSTFSTLSMNPMLRAVRALEGLIP